MNAAGRKFHLGDLKDAADPYALFESARRSGPVQRSGQGWLIFGHAEATELLRNSAARSGFIADGYRNSLPPGAAREEMSHRINFLDPPRHGCVRKLVSKAFTPRRTASLRPFVEALSRDLLDSISGDRTVDLIQAYAHEVPSLVISELLGVPIEHRDRLTKMSTRVSRLLGTGNEPNEIAEAISAAEEIHRTLRILLDARRKAPEDDLLTALLAAEDEDARLTESELLSLAATLYSAGHRTTRDLFSNGLAALLAHRELVSAIHDGTLPIAAVVEEFLRYETPTHVVARMLDEPMELGGQKISRDEPISILLAAANRDSRTYVDPGLFDPWRWTRKPEPDAPLSFALGAHFCLGASLARMEVGIMLEVLFDTFPDMELCEEPLRWHHTGVFRGLDSLSIVPIPPG